ncbi:U3 small nucleolar RNA-associated protein 19 [Sporothrix schenckii 1099-18]|uniref:U3 small nucleolar RNA-associated protein 19 n=1 Tax=Sporothrix schenckii 1099-18 TaxID=1397361 RepID=A0A0F2LW02_SPOSC|nr:U3 small nucleolar RNA-associated protein 19 [Sporothrix schenckii 1099-18]KJR81652.1 U3 small nucleolar RNA-associated protein 19 [Sporothrix schenckii 1099-18]
MPAATTTKAAAAAKRKRSTKTDAPRKRSRSENGSDDESSDNGETDVQERILLLEGQIGESKKHYNNIVELLEIAKQRGEKDEDNEDNDEDDEDDQAEEEEQSPALAAAVALCRVFMRLLAGGSLNLNRSMSDKEVVVVRWLKDRLAEYEAVLLGLLGGRSGDAASTALTLSMRLLQAQGQSRRKKAGGPGDEETYVFPQPFLTAIVRGLVLAPATLDAATAENLADEFVETYVGEYCDVQFYTFKAVSAVLADMGPDSPERNTAAHGAFYLLSLLDDVPATSDELATFYINPPPHKRSHALYSVAKHRKQAQDAWLAVLQTATSVSSSTDGKTLRKRALAISSTVIAPWFAQPEMMLDFLTDCYDAGGSTSLLALSGLYYLIQQRNVDYPAFFPKLYSLLDAELMHSKHRARFFRLLDTFLASTHLPVQMVASFIKRLARLCLHAPPSAIVSVVPWIYNMLKTHPQCTFMIHRVPRTPEARARLADEGMADPFRPLERDPMETRAIDSCLWEVVQLQSHYHPNVATIAKILAEPFTKQAYNVEDFFDHSYQSMLEAEFGKAVRKTPVVEFQIPKCIFLPHDRPAPEGADSQPGVAEDALLVKLWDFA